MLLTDDQIELLVWAEYPKCPREASCLQRAMELRYARNQYRKQLQEQKQSQIIAQQMNQIFGTPEELIKEFSEPEASFIKQII